MIEPEKERIPEPVAKRLSRDANKGRNSRAFLEQFAHNIGLGGDDSIETEIVEQVLYHICKGEKGV